MLVLGGSGTIGRAVVEALAAEGARVAFTYRNGEAAANALQKARPDALACRLDLTDISSVERVLGDVVAELSSLDAVVHCAGIGGTAEGADTIETTNEQSWDALMAVNVKSAFFACRKLLPLMTNGGNVVLVGSIDGVKPVPAPVHYASSKGALSSMARSMAKEVGASNIRVNVIAPGILESGASRVLPEELRKEYLKHCGLKRFGRPSEVANVAAFFALHNTYVTGQTIVLDGAL